MSYPLDSSCRDPFISWYFLNRREETLHRNLFSIELRGNGEFFSVLDISETALEGWIIPNETVTETCRGWCDGYKLCVRGNKDSMPEAARWTRRSILRIAADMTADLLEIQASLGVSTQLTSQESAYEVDAMVFQLVDLVGRDAKISQFDDIVHLAVVEDEKLELTSSRKLDKLDNLFASSENGYLYCFPIEDFAANRDHVSELVG